MKKSDEILLKQLKPFGLRFVGEAEWTLLEKAVDEAGSILAVDATARYIIEKASFASRSEAARYAAEQRWKGHAKAGDGDAADRKKRIQEHSVRVQTKKLSELAGDIRRIYSERGEEIPAGLARHLDALDSKNEIIGVSSAKDVLSVLQNLPQEIDSEELAGIKQNLGDRFRDYEWDDRAEPRSTAAESAKPVGDDKAAKKQRVSEIRATLKDKDISDLAGAIRREFRAQGKQIPPALRPYLDAMGSLSSVKDRYYEDTGASVVAYALSNMGTFKGETAAAIKEELKARLKGQSFIPEKGSGSKQSIGAAAAAATAAQSKGSSKQIISPSEAQIVVETMSSKTADYYREAREKQGMTHTEAYQEAKRRAAAERSGKRKR